MVKNYLRFVNIQSIESNSLENKFNLSRGICLCLYILMVSRSPRNTLQAICLCCDMKCKQQSNWNQVHWQHELWLTQSYSSQSNPEL